MSWDQPKTLEEAAQLARALAGSSLLPEVMRSPENLLLVMGYAKSMSISPFAALRLVNVINGRPTLSADGMQAVVRSSGACVRLDVVETTDEACEVVVQRNGGQPVTIRWDLRRAKQAEILGNKQWSKYPRQMLRARALSEACRLGFPDVVGGVYDPDELVAIDVTREDTKALPAPKRGAEALPSEPHPVAQKALPVEPEPAPNSPEPPAPKVAKLSSAEASALCLKAEALLVETASVAREAVHELLVARLKALQPKGIPSAEVIERATFEVALAWTAESLAVVFGGEVTVAEDELRKAVGAASSVDAVVASAKAIIAETCEDGDVEA